MTDKMSEDKKIWYIDPLSLVSSWFIIVSKTRHIGRFYRRKDADLAIKSVNERDALLEKLEQQSEAITMLREALILYSINDHELLGINDCDEDCEVCVGKKALADTAKYSLENTRENSGEK